MENLGSEFPPQEENERTTEIEAKLQDLLTSVPGVKNVQGCSSNDFKVNFNHESDLPEHPTYSYNLQYNPQEEYLCAHPLGLPYGLPDAIKQSFAQRFPKANYRFTKGAGQDGFHYWVGVKEAQL